MANTFLLSENSLASKIFYMLSQEPKIVIKQIEICISACNWDVSGYLEVFGTLEPLLSYEVSSREKLFNQHVQKEQCFLTFHLFHLNYTPGEPAPDLEASSKPETRTQNWTPGSYSFAVETAADSKFSFANPTAIPRPQFFCFLLPHCLCCNLSPSFSSFYSSSLCSFFVWEILWMERREWADATSVSISHGGGSICRHQRQPGDSGDLHLETVPLMRNFYWKS